MTYRSFKKLARMLHKPIMQAQQKKAQNYRYIPNGAITTSVRLACAMRYFAGGCPYDIMTTYNIGHTDTLMSVWFVVDAINSHPEFSVSYPSNHEEQRLIARGFQQVSEAGFDCCAGAIDGVLIWIHKPSENDCESVGCSSGKFFCGRKHKFGMNCQAICDSRGRFLDLSIMFPGSTSDCLAFEGMSLYEKLQENSNFLAPGLCFFGDNAYIKALFMATPFPGVSGGTKDAITSTTHRLEFALSVPLGCSLSDLASCARRCQ